MQTWFQSSFLQSLGFAIANSLWQAGLLWLLYALLNHLLRMSASAKYRMAVALQLLSFVWFVVTIQFYYIQYSESLKQSASTGYQGVQAVLAGDGGFTSQVIRYMVWAEQALPYISVAYLLLIVLLAARWINSFRYTQSIRTEGLHKMPVDWRLFIQRVAPQLGIKKNITLFLSEKITTPLTIGFWKPVILVPLASINHLTTEQLEAVLLHELAHIKRYDYLVNIFLSIVEISLFFNPFTQLLSKSIRKERENCCDDWVLQFQYSASDYAQALLRIASLQSVPAFAMAAGGKKNELLVRVKRMIGQPENAFSYRKQLLSLLLVTGMLGCMAWFNPSANTHRRQTEKTTGKTTTVAIEPMAMKVDNPLFNPVFFLSEPLKTEMRKSIASAKEEVNTLTIQDASKDFVASIPPMVAAALEKASAALEQQRYSLPRQQVAGMQAAKSQMEHLLRDSLSFPLTFRKQLTGEVSRSLQNMDISLAGAQQGLDKAAKEIRNLRLQFDKEKFAKDIRVAMNEVTSIDLGNLINTSLKMAGMTELPAEEVEMNRKPRTPKKAAAPPDDVSSHQLPANVDAGNDDTDTEDTGDNTITPHETTGTFSLLPLATQRDVEMVLVKAVQPVFSKEYLEQLKKIALLALASRNNADPETEKRILHAIEQLRQSITRQKLRSKDCDQQEIMIRMQ